MLEYKGVGDDDNDDEEAGGAGNKKAARPIRWMRRHVKDCCGCIGDCATCSAKVVLAIVIPLIVVAVIIIVLLIVLLPKAGVQPAEVAETAKSIWTSWWGGGSGGGNVLLTNRYVFASQGPSSPWAPPVLPSLGGTIDLPPQTSLVINMSWLGVASSDLAAVSVITRRRLDATTTSLGSLPLPSSLTQGAHSWSCSSDLPTGFCSSLTSAWSTGDTLYVVLLRALPPLQGNALVTAEVKH
jgi:hypothetical protein